MALTKEQYFAMGKADSASTGTVAHPTLSTGTSWQAIAYQTGYQSGRVIEKTAADLGIAQAPAPVAPATPVTTDSNCALYFPGKTYASLQKAGEATGSCSTPFRTGPQSIPRESRLQRRHIQDATEALHSHLGLLLKEVSSEPMHARRNRLIKKAAKIEAKLDWQRRRSFGVRFDGVAGA